MLKGKQFNLEGYVSEVIYPSTLQAKHADITDLVFLFKKSKKER